ncbi:MAG: sodium:solute symporter family protein [Planctomycetota bacterium]
MSALPCHRRFAQYQKRMHGMLALHTIDYVIIGLYGIGVIVAGVILSRRAAESVDSYFLGGRSIPWYLLGISNASGMFDITGTMWMVMLLFVYGPKSLWIPWVWPTFNQVFLMIFLAAWLRRSGVITGAEWLRTRFGNGAGLELAHLSVVLFALVSVISFIALAFIGVGKFAAAMLPWGYEPNTYGMVVIGITAIYVIIGGMYSVVLTDVIQFFLLTIAAVMVCVIAMTLTTTEGIAAVTPDGWQSLWFGWRVDLDWNAVLPKVSEKISSDGYEFFTPFLLMALLKGVLSSIAGPTPGYDMQRVLATKDERAAALMSGMVSPILFVPRYMLIAGITVLALTYYSTELATQDEPDFEQILPYVVQNFIPVGLSGILLAGLFSAFMSTFDSTVNAGAAYIVNDICKRYIWPQATERQLIRLCYIASAIIVVVGMYVGLYPKSINSHMQWIVGGLYGGYAAPNVLKWVWWRLNGVGYFAGMVTGVFLSLALANYSDAILQWMSAAMPDIHDVIHAAPSLYFFPVLLVGSGLASVVASWLTSPDDPDVLDKFYSDVRPWGVWQPVVQRLQSKDSSFVPNRDFARDMANCAVGIVWQVALSAAPVYLVLRNFSATAAAVVVVIVTSIILKRNWYDRLQPRASR